MALRRIKGSWWVDVRFRRPDGLRDRYRLRSPDNSRDGAGRYEREVLDRLAKGERVYGARDARPSWDRRFAGFSAQWFELYVTSNVEKSTQNEYARVLRRALVPSFGSLRLEEVDPYQIERFKAKRREEGASAKTVNNDLFVLSKLLRTAQEWGALGATPKLRYLPQDPVETDFLTGAESKRLLEYTHNPKWRVFFFVALRTGLRAGELLALRWEDIDLERRIIIVRRNIVDGVVKFPKKRRIRYVAVAWDLHAVLEQLKQPVGYLFTQWGDEPVKRSMAYNALQRALKKAGMRRVGLHALRHSFAAHFMMGAKDMYSLQRLLGHSNIMTTERYAHLAPEYMRSAIDMVPAAGGDLAGLVGHRMGNPWAPNGEQEANTPRETLGPDPAFSANHNEKGPALPVPFHGRNDRD